MPTILITGGHSGLGLECSRLLASTYHVDLVLAGRNLAAMEPIAQDLRSAYSVNVRTIEMDTSSLASVRAGVAHFRRMLVNKEVGPLQAVVCNAGVRMNGPVTYTPDNYETTIATNYLGHTLLVQLLLDKLENNGRVILTTSGTHDPDTPDGKMMGIADNYDVIGLANTGKDGKKPVDNGKLYSTSKLYMIQFIYELDRRLRKAGSEIVPIAYDPGATQGTGFLRSMPGIVQWLAGTALMKWIMKRSGVTIGTVEFSGKSLALLAADSAYKNGSGKYFQSNDGQLIERRSSKLSYDEARALKLWTDTKDLIHLQPDEEPLCLATHKS
jgi:NAD(P)-dependent dehydrogenase (short-subunit alcohol dehydrogenase family)